MNKRLRTLAFFALAIVLNYTTLASAFITRRPIVNHWFDTGLVFLTSVGFYQILVDWIFWAFCKFRFLLSLYWGQEFFDDLWSYCYTIEGDTDRKVYFGVWRFDQTLYETSVVGFGLSEDFSVRSRVRSVGDISQRGAEYEIVNVRSDSHDPAADYLSRTIMYFEYDTRFLRKFPVRMRGKTIIYGGPRNGRVCNNHFVRHEGARTEQDVIDLLRSNFETHGSSHPSPARQKAAS